LSVLALKAEGLQLLLLQLGGLLSCVIVLGAALSLLVDDDISGLWHHHPVIAFCLLIGGIALAGLPPSIGFFAHWLLLSELVGLGYGWVVVLLVIASVFAALVPLRWIVEMGAFREGEVHAIDVRQPRWVMVLGAVLLLGGGAGFGPLMGALFDVARGVAPA
jgi:NADH-quinone oxidoreductase subunit N